MMLPDDQQHVDDPVDPLPEPEPEPEPVKAPVYIPATRRTERIRLRSGKVVSRVVDQR